MRSLIRLGLVLTVGCTGAAASGAADEFVASTPCDPIPRGFLGIAADVPCERITWQLTLSGASSGAYTLRALYGMTVPNTPNLRDGGTTAVLHGDWTAAKPATPGAGDVVRLGLRDSSRALQLRRLDDNLLHLLDDRGALLVGNGGWSYTLNRRNGKAAARSVAPFRSADRAPDVEAGVFDGRSPCLAIAAQVKASVASDCAKLKWRLVLRRDPATGLPGPYTLEGTLYRDRPRTGRWSVERHSSDPHKVVLRLDAGESGVSLSFLKADDNVLLFLDDAGRPLVGNVDFSYTLNRTTR